MIHTVKMFFPITHYDIQYLQLRHEIQYTEIEGYFKQTQPAFTSLSINNYGNGIWKLYAVIDLIKLLETPNFSESDYLTVEHRIKQFLRELFGHASCYKEHVLQRIDYRKDVVIPNTNEREALFHMYKKCTAKHGYHKKIIGKKNKEEGKFEEYKTSQYHATKNSTELCIYDKAEERVSKNEPIADYEKDVLRFEVRLKKTHINHMASSKKGKSRPKKLQEYMKDELYKEYMDKYTKPFLYGGDYYTVYGARKVLKASNLSDSWKKKLDTFLVTVSEHGIDYLKKSMKRPTFNKRINLLVELGINPILIPKNQSVFPTFIKNPFLR
jgi:hypothetical protein